MTGESGKSDFRGKGEGRGNGFWRTFPGGLLLVILTVSWQAVCAQEHHGHGHTAEPVAMQDMVVTAERIDAYVENHPQNVVVLSMEEIRRRNLLSVEEALSTMPGVDVKKSTGIGSRISIRGSGKVGGVLVLLNGRPLNSSQYGGADVSSIPIDIVKSITVFKPPVPVWLGAGAGEGAIMITTRDSVDAAEKESKHLTRIRAAGGSHGRAEATVSHRYTMKSASVMATAGGSHRDGKRINSDRDNGNFSLHWGRELVGGRRVELYGRYYLSEHGSSGPEDNPTPDARQTYRKGSLDSRLSGIIGTTSDYTLNVYGDVVVLRDKSQSGFVSTLDSRKIGLKGETNWNPGENDRGLQLSGILEHDDVDHTLSGAHDRTTAGLGAQAGYHWKAFGVSLGLRGDYTSDFDFNPGFSAGLRFALTRAWSIKANAGYTVTIPTFGQLYQPSHGSIDQVRGNPDLVEEKIWSYDTTLEYRQGKSHLFQVTGFRSDSRDPIVHLRGDDLIYRPVNAERSWRQGVEANWKCTFDVGLTLAADAIVQESKNEETGGELSYTPRLKLNLTMLYTLPTPGTRLETSVRYVGKQYSEARNRQDQRLDAYTAVDLKAIQPFTVKGRAMEWFIHCDNVFNKQFEIHRGYPDEGFRFLAGLNVTI